MERDSNPFQAPSEARVRDLIFENRLLNYSEAARYLSVSESYLRKLKRRGKVPFVPMGNRGVRFRVSSLTLWIEKREML